jgi:hypothetical protein
MEHFVLRITHTFSKFPSAIIVFLLVSINFLDFIPHSNEEHYFALAKQFYNPEWLPYSFSFNEFPGTRLIFQYIVGFILQYLSFEQMAFWGRLVNFLLLSIPLANLFKKLKLNNIHIIVFLQLLFLSNQSFMGGEWIFKAFEPKTLSYIFVFYAINSILESKHFRAIVFIVISTYFHILVGGWMAVLYFIYVFLTKNKLTVIVKYLSIYTLSILPFLYYLFSNLFLNQHQPQTSNIDWIYTYLRAPHHCAPFASYLNFKTHFLFGLLVIIAFYILNELYFNKIKDEGIQTISKLFKASLIILFLGFFISIFDRNGIILKYYVFRIASISSLLAFLLLSYYIVYELISYKKQETANVFLLILIIPFILFKIVDLKDRFNAKSNYYYIQLLSDWAKNNTQKSDLFLFLDVSDSETLVFPRHAKRSSFVIEKAIPAGGTKIEEWYRRINLKNQIIQNPNQYKELIKNEKIDFIITKKLNFEGKEEATVYKNELYQIISTSKINY